ncbi:uncharacterized protein LODBEIA_P41970 [Lodderomyces beijingensis]|uniref:Triacylglycerol lipase n=1 Tax=Lodderomyces beijingensis TaxID=1775926 RepID=A0ABP0ZP88_9ASCO
MTMTMTMIMTMMKMTTTMYILLSLLCLCPFANCSVLNLLPPSQDPFYQPPRNLANLDPGTIIKHRPTPQKLSNVFFTFNLKNSWQLMYRTTDTFGNATATIITIMEPHNATADKVISYQTAEDSAHIDCSPSYGFQFGAPHSTLMTHLDMRFMIPALSRGFYVISSDYEGPNSAFLAGMSSGYATLDGIRAALQSGNITGISNEARVVIWGYSGGSVPTGFAACLQSSYAPELSRSLIGCAMGGIVVNITSAAQAADCTVFSGLIPLALNGLCNEYPVFEREIYDNIGPNHLENFIWSQTNCWIPGMYHYQYTNFFTGDNRTFQRGFDILQDAQIRRIVNENCLINLNQSYLPQVPVFVYHALLDEVTPLQDALQLYRQWCDWGIRSFEFAEDFLNEHVSEQAFGAGAAWTWIEARFDGVEPVSGCEHTSRWNNLYYPNVSQDVRDLLTGYNHTLIDLLVKDEKWEV